MQRWADSIRPYLAWAGVSQRPVPFWSRTMLRSMLLSERYVPPPLYLKLDVKGDLESRKIEIRRLHNLRDGQAYVEKRYVGAYEQRADEESGLLDAVRSLPGVKDHLVEYAGKDHAPGGGTVSSTYIRTRWSGLSIQNWQHLLPDERLPFFGSIQAQLALVRAVVRALEPFHKAGFVHGDLLAQNIVFPARQTKGGLWLMELDKLRLIDLEFTLGPITPLRLANTTSIVRRTDWFREKSKAVIWIHPTGHSLQLVPGQFSWETANVDGIPVAKIKRGPLHPNAQLHLYQANWTADFYSLAYWLKLINERARYQDDGEFPNAVTYLASLLQDFEAWDNPQPPASPNTSYPHADIVSKINDLIGFREPEAQLSFTLPRRKALRLLDLQHPLDREDNSVAAAASTTQDDSHAAPPILSKIPLTKVGGAVAAFAVVGGSIIGLPALLPNGLSFEWAREFARTFTRPSPTTASTTPDRVAEPQAPPPPPSAPSRAQPPIQPPAPPAPTPITPPPPTASELLATAQAAVQAAAPGTNDWQTALKQAAALAANNELPVAERDRFYAQLQARYREQTQPILQSTWWNEPEPNKGRLPPAQRDWMRASNTLAALGLWEAATYEARAVASGRGGLARNASQTSAAQVNLATWALAPAFGPFAPLPAPQLLVQKLEIAQLLTDIALVQAHHAKRAQQPLPASATDKLLPLLQHLAALPNPHGQILLGVAATCLQQPPATALANAQFQLAAKASGGNDAAAIAADAKAWLAGQQRCL